MSPDSPINEQESWNKRFEMSLAEIYMELPDGHRAKKDYEALIAEPRGKMVEMSMRIDELEETVRELQLKAPSLIAKPKPVATLCEVVERLLTAADEQYCGSVLEPLLENLRHALTAEKKRQGLVDSLVCGVRNWRKEGVVPYIIGKRLDALDAFDKGAENG